MNEAEESKDAKVEMMMQPQDYVIAEAGKEAKIRQITEAYQQEAADSKKILKRAK